MPPLSERKIILVTRPTRLAELVRRFNTVAQARFYLEHLGADFTDYQQEDEQYARAVAEAQRTLARLARLQLVERRFLPNFLFGAKDVVVALGQDGLVANTLKYLDGQPVVGVNPDPHRWDGALLPFRVGDLLGLLPEVLHGRRPSKSVTMAQVALNTGPTLYAVNDFFIGLRSHGSARYRIRMGDRIEQQSSSGVIVSTGLGSTGWLRSLLTGAAAIASAVALDRPAEFSPSCEGQGGSPEGCPSGPGLPLTGAVPWDADFLYFTVREPFPSQTTGTSLVFGRILPQRCLTLESQMAENGVVFSDGIEHDFLEFNAGTRAEVRVAERKGVLVV